MRISAHNLGIFPHKSVQNAKKVTHFCWHKRCSTRLEFPEIPQFFRSLGAIAVTVRQGTAHLIGTLDQRYREVTIVGAGIAGMLGAYSLDHSGYRVTLLEQKQRGGGLNKTTRTEHGIAESAAHSLITTDAVRELCRDLCVELIEPRKESRTKFIVRNGHVVRFPLNLKEALNLAGHVAFTRSTGANEPADAWARRHLGDSGTEYLLRRVPVYISE